MSSLLNKLLMKSDSYKYYKSQHKILKKQLKICELEKKELDAHLNSTINNLQNLETNYIELHKNHIHLENEIYANRIQENLVLLRQKTENNKIVNITFLINFAITTMDKIIQLFEEDPRFNPTVIVIPYDPHALNIFDKGLTKHQIKEYVENYNYFIKKGFNVIKGYDIETRTLIDLEFELKPDILFYSTPWEPSLPEQFRIRNLPKNILFSYIPYGIYAAQMQEDQFNRELHNKAWKVFAETLKHKDLATKYSSTGASNVIVTGYPKMDPLIDGTHSKNPYSWKDETHNKKRIIWAPHHSFGSSVIGFSTFDKNYKSFLDYAKKNSEIEWVFKPHPTLRYSKTYNEKEDNFSEENLEKYYNNWAKLANATVYEGGDYLNLFATSDAMITDSVSFLSEYLYVKKPGLFLTRPSQKFNEYGEIIKNAWYQIDGADFKAIEQFIDDVVLNGNDPLKNKRDDIYNTYLNTNGITASEKIYDYIRGSLLIN